MSEYHCPWKGYERLFRKSGDKNSDRYNPDIMSKWISWMVTGLLEENLKNVTKENSAEEKERNKVLILTRAPTTYLVL